MRTIYFVPGPENLDGKLFLANPNAPVNPLGGDFKKILLDNGIDVKTIDAWSPDIHKNDDILFVWGVHPEETVFRSFIFWLRSRITGRPRYAVGRRKLSELLKIFSKKILYQIEVPINTPYPFRHIGRLSEIYDKILLFLKDKDFSGPNIGYLMAPVAFREDYLLLHKTLKDKFLVMVNSNMRPKGFLKKELYSERLRAIRFFSQYDDFDLYGTRWDRRPFFPYWYYYPSIKKSWRGMIPLGEQEKIVAISRYKFAICFENSEYCGYVSEKIFHCIFADTVPIYLGAPDITDYVPANCFIDMRKFKDYSELLKFLRGISEAERATYVKNMENYIEKERNGLFSPRVFAEKILKIVTE